MAEQKPGEPISPQEIDWQTEIGYEVEGQSYKYVLPKDPEKVGRMVTAAVYKLLSGNEISDREKERFIKDSPTSIPDEETEYLARALFDQVRYKLMENNNYENEWEEARRQGDAAREWLQRNNDFGFSTYYDYYKGLIPIKAGIYLDRDKKDPKTIIMSAPMAEVAAVRGFPSMLLYRSVDRKRLQKEGVDSMEFLGKVIQKFGLSRQTIVQGMFNDELNMVFVLALNDCGHTDFDKVRSAVVYSGREGYPNYTPQELYEMLNDKEKQAIQIPRERDLNVKILLDLKHGRTNARFEISLLDEGRCSIQSSDNVY